MCDGEKEKIRKKIRIKKNDELNYLKFGWKK